MFLLYSFPNVTGYCTLCRRGPSVGRISFYFLEGESVFSESLSFGDVSFPSPCLSELPGITLSVFSPGDTVVREALLAGAKDCSQPALQGGAIED